MGGHDGQLLTELWNMDDHLHGLSSDSFRGTMITQDLEDLTLGSDEEMDTTVISAPRKTPDAEGPNTSGSQKTTHEA